MLDVHQSADVGLQHAHALQQGLRGRYQGQPLRVLVIPGLRNSGDAHWQTWLQGQYRGAVRVQQDDWERPDVEAWSQRIAQTIARSSPETEWVAVAHSFGCLALTHHLARHAASSKPDAGRIRSALLVAPADPDKFGVGDQLPAEGLGIASTLIASETDPWMPLERARLWAHAWGSRLVNLGDAGHINVDSGYGPWPLARYWVDHLIRDQQRARRLQRAHPMELNYAV